ncbi:Apoptosis-inducing factor 2 [Mortierella sp. GBA30]|nr:Apoptosis-inducing factor 2 [Mortierella sp. GBA30]
MTSTKPVKVVVVGGSFAGVAVIKTLLSTIESTRKNIQIILIERRDARHHSIGAFRALVDEEFGKKIWLPYTSLFPKNSHHKIVRGKLAEVHHNHVVLASGETVTFNYLAICTGSTNPTPGKFNVDTSQEAIVITNRARVDLQKAKDIVIVGGGACGVELAGEIKTAFPEKNVTLIHASAALVDYPGFANSFKSAAQAHLKALGVDVILNEKIVIDGLGRENAIQVAPRIIRTKAGKVIESDMQFFSVGNDVDTSYISTLKPAGKEASFDSQTLIHKDSNRIRVRKTLQLVDFDHIFAVGDCSDFSTVPTAAAISFAGPSAGKNILALINAEEKHKIAKLANGSEPPKAMLLSTGPTTGISTLPLLGSRFSNFFAKFKSKDMMIGYTVSDMNLK